MDPLASALQAAAGNAVALAPGRDAGAPGAAAGLPPLETALLVGAGGRLGSALLAEALVAGRFASVGALVAAPLTSTLRGLRPVSAAQLAVAGDSTMLAADLAFIVLERERSSNGRDDAFVAPQPAELTRLARQLRNAGVRRLLVVLPHASAMLPAALSHGLASRDEAAVAALGFEHVVLFKPSQDVQAPRAATALGRLAQWWLSQLRWMVPEREQPLRADALTRLAVQVARALPCAAPGTHVLPQALMWQLARDADGGQARLERRLARAPESDDPRPSGLSGPAAPATPTAPTALGGPR